MKASELRIGNWVKYDSQYHVVTSIHRGGNVSVRLLDENFPSETTGITKIQPIPLTEEWLVKFGFNVIKHVMAKIALTEGWLEIETDFSYGIIPNEEAYSFGHWWSGKLKYVHQLQNLYFALTGEELKIKE